MDFSFLLPTVRGIPVLMYHNVLPGISDALTITPEKLIEHWQWLKQNGYTPLSLSEYISCIDSNSFPPQSVLLTFDDGCLNNYEYAYPLLKEMGWCATFFIIAEALTRDIKLKMSLRELAQLDPDTVQLALHGFHHEHFSELSLDEIQQVMVQSIAAFDNSGLPYHKVLAYPFGSRPKNLSNNTAMKEWFKRIGIQAAFRIGNQVSRIPAPDRYELKRIDIKGTDTLEQFKIKLIKGKLKPF